MAGYGVFAADIVAYFTGKRAVAHGQLLRRLFFLYIEGTAASQLAYRSKEGYGAAYSSAKGLLTGTQVFDLTDRSKYAITVYYYDEYGNPVQTRTRHVSGDYEMTYAQCDLSGNILKSYTEHLDSRGVYRYRSS